jgi:hypothetical protein
MPDQEKPESLSEKRRKILRKGDWVGVSIQRPLQLTFASPRKEENIGRRRKITHGHQARYRSKQLHISSPFHIQTRRAPEQSSSQAGRQYREGARTDVRISIGGRVVPPGVSSSSAPRRMGSHSTIARKRSHTTSSDVMLLDTGFVQETIRTETGDLTNRRFSTSVHQIYPHNQDLNLIYASTASDEADDNNMPNKAADIGDGLASVFSETASELQEDILDQINCLDNPKPSPESHDCGTNCVFDKQDAQDGRLIFSTSTASIHHPAPRSSRVSVLLRSSSSDIAESTKAQVGMYKSIVPSSQVLENEIWKTWIAPEEYDDRYNLNERRQIHRISISPGVSKSYALWRTNSMEDDDEDDCLSKPQAQNSEAAATRSEQQDIPVSWSSVTESQASSSPEPTHHEVEKIEDMAEEEGEMTSLAGKELPNAIPPIHPHNSIIEEDQIESWTRFLFGGVGEELEVTIPTTELNIEPIEKDRFFSTSILGQASGDESALPDLTPYFENTNTSATPHLRSGGASEIRSASPCPSGSRYRESRLQMESTGSHPTWKGGLSVRAEKGSILMSSSDSISISEAAHPIPSDSTSERLEITNKCNPQIKVTFTRPKPFIGSQTHLNSTQQCETLHIGRGLREAGERYNLGKKWKRDVRNFLDMVEQDEQEEVESIEDDGNLL